MNYKELLNILNRSEIGGNDITFLKKYVKENRKETDEVDDEILRHTLDLMRNKNIKSIIFVCEQIANGIRFLVINEDWSNLTQILRSLPKEIQEAIPEGDSVGVLIMMEFAKDVDAFLNLSSEQRKKALAAV